MRYVIPLTVPAIMFFAFLAQATASDGQTGRYRLAQVRFTGIQGISKTKLARTLVAQTPPRWRFWADKTVVTEADLKDDLLRIQQFYRGKGYYHTKSSYQIEPVEAAQPDHPEGTVRQAEASAEVSEDIPPHTVVVTYKIDEGPPAIIEHVEMTIKDTDEAPYDLSREDLYVQTAVEVGDIFQVETYNETKRVLLRHLGNTGYPMAKVEGLVKVYTNENKAHISLHLTPGPRCRFGRLFISGNDAYVETAIIEQAMTFKEGEIYSAKKLETSQRNLFNLSIFSVARVSPETLGRDTAKVPIRVQVKPRDRQKVRLGVGYGSEDGVRLKGAWTYRNPSGWADRISLSAKRSDLLRTVQGEYDIPYFLDPKNTFSARAGFEQELLETYENRKTFGNATVTRYLYENWTATLGYNLEANDLREVDITDSEASILGISEENYFIASLESGIIRSTTNSLINPSSGSVSSLHVEAASDLLGSEVSFFKPTFRLTKYQSISANLVAAGRIRLRAIQETEGTRNIPIFKRLFLGGSNSVRGYGYQKLGPVDETGTPLGGLSAIDANLELRYPIFGKFSGVVFLDAGLVDPTAFRYELGDMRYSCGLGLRYHTVIGPIRVDFGYKLNPPSKRDFGKSENPDEAVEDRWKIHLSVGQAF